ncbi:MAG: undecaprenyldiphospho-muramoylpentapeptide beta-N-acetylglucosaminyltransferase [Bacillota bacterium]
MKIIITGGGTGGHVYPALAIAKGIRDLIPNSELMYVGTKSGLEAKVVPKEGINFKTITVEGLPRVVSIQSLRSGFKLMAGLGESFKIISAFKPELIIATGGYVSGPIAWVGTQMGVPLVLHEQNSVPGKTNRLLAKRAKKICLTFEDSKVYFKDRSKVKVTGLPIRDEILLAAREASIKNLGLDPLKKTLLITGGSRGAHSINMAVVDALPDLVLRQDLQVILVTGERRYKETLHELENKGIKKASMGNITIKPYLYHMEHGLGCADMVVGRSGAAFLAEVTAKGIPSILIPYPYAADNHQEYNAKSLVKAGASMVISDHELNGQLLLDRLFSILDNKQKYEAMKKAALSMGKPDALSRILREIQAII